jgi:hypothetical protein
VLGEISHKDKSLSLSPVMKSSLASVFRYIHLKEARHYKLLYWQHCSHRSLAREALAYSIVLCRACKGSRYIRIV